MKHWLIVTECKYGEMRSPELKEFNSQESLDEAVQDYKEQFEEDKDCYDKWRLFVETSNGIKFNGKVDL